MFVFERCPFYRRDNEGFKLISTNFSLKCSKLRSGLRKFVAMFKSSNEIHKPLCKVGI